MQDRINQKDEYIAQLEEDIFNKQKEMHELEKNNVIMKKKLKKIIHEQGISGVTYREGESEGRNEDSRVKQKIDAEEDL